LDRERRHGAGKAAASFAAQDEQQREQAMARFALLRPHLEDGVPLTRAADAAGIPVRTAGRWLARYRQSGMAGMARSNRCDAGTHRSPADLIALIEGMALKRPRSLAAAIHRRICTAVAQAWRVSSSIDARPPFVAAPGTPQAVLHTL